MFVCAIQFLCNISFLDVPSCSSISKIVCSLTCHVWNPHLTIYMAYRLLLEFMAGKNWIKAMVLTASLFPFLCFSIGFALNTIAIFYRSLAAIPFGTMVVMFVLWAFISFPLVLLGTVVGRNWSGAPNNPCRVKTIPRPIPEKKWYLTPSVISLMGGLLPFGSIFIEMYFVFTSFWNYKVNEQMLFNIFVPLDIASLTTVILYCKVCMVAYFLNFLW
jgi:transmembrane 9 superfamily member 3